MRNSSLVLFTIKHFLLLIDQDVHSEAKSQGAGVGRRFNIDWS